MALTVVVRSGAGESPPSISLDTPRAIIGRGGGCEVRLPDPTVSHRHASIRQRGGDYIIVDEGSTNGTFVGPVRLSAQAPRVLRSGDQVRVGRVWIEVRIDASPTASTGHAATKELAMALVAHALEADGEAAVARARVVGGPDVGKVLVLKERERAYVLGRGKTCDLVLDDPDASRRHVEFTWTAAGIMVRDLGAKNGTWCGDKRLTSGDSARVQQEERVVVGATEILCEDPVSEALEQLERAADERLQDGEALPPPSENAGRARPVETVPPNTKTEEPPVPSSLPSRRTAARAAASTQERSFNLTDYLVVLIALAVIASSLFGLRWLLASD